MIRTVNKQTNRQNKTNEAATTAKKERKKGKQETRKYIK